MSTISRRDFMKTAGVMTLAVAASAALAGCSTENVDDIVPTPTPAPVQTSSTSVTMGDYTFAINKAMKVKIDKNGATNFNYNGAPARLGDHFVLIDFTITCNVDGVTDDFIAEMYPKIGGMEPLGSNNGAAAADTAYTEGVAEILGLNNTFSVVDANTTHLNVANGWGSNSGRGGNALYYAQVDDDSWGIHVDGDPNSSKGDVIHMIAAFVVDVNHTAAADEAGATAQTATRTYATPSLTIGVKDRDAKRVATLVADIPSTATTVNTARLLGVGA